MVERRPRPFQRAKLVTHAAVLEQELRHALDAARDKLEEAEEGGYGERIVGAFRDRVASLDDAREAVMSARVTLSYCK
jgi:hypothetical protein